MSYSLDNTTWGVNHIVTTVTLFSVTFSCFYCFIRTFCNINSCSIPLLVLELYAGGNKFLWLYIRKEKKVIKESEGSKLKVYVMPIFNNSPCYLLSIYSREIYSNSFPEVRSHSREVASSKPEVKSFSYLQIKQIAISASLHNLVSISSRKLYCNLFLHRSSWR